MYISNFSSMIWLSWKRLFLCVIGYEWIVSAIDEHLTFNQRTTGLYGLRNIVYSLLPFNKGTWSSIPDGNALVSTYVFQ